MPGHTKCCNCRAKSSQQTWRSEAPKCNPSQRPDRITALMNMSLVLRLPRKMHLCRSSSNVPRLPPFFWKCYKTLTFFSLLTRSTIPCACHAKRHPNVQKWREHVVLLNAFNILTSKCASRHNGAHFFDIATSKNGPEHVLCAFWLGNVLRATTACTFSTSQPGLFDFLFWKYSPINIIHMPFLPFWVYGWYFWNLVLRTAHQQCSIHLFLPVLFSNIWAQLLQAAADTLPLAGLCHQSSGCGGAMVLHLSYLRTLFPTVLPILDGSSSTRSLYAQSLSPAGLDGL